ncbi:hypothetical protein EDC01DRAFT_791957 [Geopyxis carbonaria]|nr:hypothetical protein EDC01DRAFT_791957 [Geopyxis carbonaria]
MRRESCVEKDGGGDERRWWRDALACTPPAVGGDKGLVVLVLVLVLVVHPPSTSIHVLLSITITTTAHPHHHGPPAHPPPPPSMASELLLHPASTSLSDARRRIFDSVFPPNISASLPTPLSTPTASFAEPPPPRTPSHGYNTRHHPTPTPASPASTTAALTAALDPAASVTLLPNPAAVLAREARAWHLATSYLSFASTPFPATPREWLLGKPRAAPEVVEAIRYLLVNSEDGNVDGRENLVEWYVCEVRRHFLECVKPTTRIPKDYGSGDAFEILEDVLGRLTAAQSIYLHQLKEYLLITPSDPSPRKTPKKGRKKVRAGGESAESERRVKAFTKSLNSIISYSLPDPTWSDLVYRVMVQLCGMAVGFEDEDSDSEESESEEAVSEPGSTGSTIVMDDDDSIYDAIPQSFRTETDLDGDIIVATDDGRPIIPHEMDGLSDFSDFRARRTNQARQGAKIEARKKVLELWEALETIGVGGGGRRGEKVFAEVVNTLITQYIHRSFSQKWHSPSEAGRMLEDWVETVLGRLILDVLFSFTVKEKAGDARLDKLSPRESLRASRQSLDKRRMGGMDLDGGHGAGEEEQKRRNEDLAIWKDIALKRLGRLRVNELFDIVVDWPHSLGGIEDLKSYIDSPPTRLHLITTFTAAISQRILHPAAATSDVISAYIRLIRAFTQLDTRGVLLDRVSRGIRQYLRGRQDTINTIISGIMLEQPTEGTLEDCGEIMELADELAKGMPLLTAAAEGVEDLDYDDMTWVPDPVDAGPDYRRSKGLDVIGSLFSLFDTKDPWVREIQRVLTKRLLNNPTYEFTDEHRITELLKLRFGDAMTQGSDVMLKDISDSRRVDGLIRDLQKLHLRHPGRSHERAIEFHAKVISRLYWSNLKAPSPDGGDGFRLPDPIQSLMNRYRTGFEHLKPKRRLDWLPSEGVVALELELTDRVIAVENATPAQAAVITLFQADPDEEDDPALDPVQLHLQELLARLAPIPEPALRAALKFWVDKTVLAEVAPGVFSVLEVLASHPSTPQPGTEHHAAAAEDAESPEDEARRAQRTLVESFVVGMLTNGGAMPAERIGAMLAMLVPGGFRWSGEELVELLKEMAGREVVEIGAGGWRVVG